MNVLLIDDDELTHQVVGAFIKQYSREHEIDTGIKALHDPVQGLLEISENGDNYDVILLDVRLPRLRGDEIYKSMISKTPELLERIIFITSSPHQLHQKLPDHDLRVLGKPFRYQMFEFQLSDVCQRYEATGQPH